MDSKKKVNQILQSKRGGAHELRGKKAKRAKQKHEHIKQMRNGV